MADDVAVAPRQGSTNNTPKGRSRRVGYLWYYFWLKPEPLIFAFLAILVAVFSSLSPGPFLSEINLRNIGIDAAEMLIISIGMCFVLVSGAIDLSLGSVLVFASVTSLKTMAAMGSSTASIYVGIAVALASGVLWGLVNGVLVAVFKLESLIVTLATMGAALGVANLLTGGVNVVGVPASLASWSTMRTAGVPLLVWIGVGIALVFGFVLRNTTFGRHAYAIGSNAEAARRCGVRSTSQLVRTFALAGLLAGFAGIVDLARFSTTTIEGHTTDILVAITAVVLGGASLSGGRGTVFGTVIGVLIPVVMTSGLVIVGMQSFWQQVIIGVILVLAVLVDRERRRRLKAE